MLLRHKDLKFSLYGSVAFQLCVNLMLVEGARCPCMVQNCVVEVGWVYLCTFPHVLINWKIVTGQREKFFSSFLRKSYFLFLRS